MIKRVGKKEYEIFHKECRRLLKKWGVNDLRVDIGQAEIADNHLADSATNVLGRVASIRINKAWDDGEDSSMDELDPDAGRHTPPVVEDCGIFCEAMRLPRGER